MPDRAKLLALTVEGAESLEEAEKGSIGSSFRDFLDEAGIREEVGAQALKEVLAWQVEQAKIAQSLTGSCWHDGRRQSRGRPRKR